MITKHILTVLAAVFCVSSFCIAQSDSTPNELNIILVPDAHQRVVYGAEQLQKALQNTGNKVLLTKATTAKPEANTILIGTQKDGDAFDDALKPYENKKEGFALLCRPEANIIIAGVDESGALYGCLELAERIESAEGQLPDQLDFYDSPVMRLRGPCIGMQRPEIIYDGVMYNYRYLPETFPWFYDRQLWTTYLDLLVKHRSNTLYLWNGHPFTSLLRLEKYPEAQEVDTEQLEQNIDLFNWLCSEADKRGIWVVQFFYNIHLSHTLARHHNVPYVHAVPSELSRDYTRYCITEFIKNYPHVGLMTCLGEALKDQYDVEWMTDVIIRGVKAGLKPGQENPPIIVRNHSTPIKDVLDAARPIYDNIYTMAKYTCETLASDKVAGGSEDNTQLNEWELRKELAKDYMLIINVHCVCNLEPFRWGSPTFIRNAMQSCEQIGIKGLHLYPLRYWDWPVTADITDPPLMQPERDWLWYAAWARYAWNPDRDAKQEEAFWINQIAEQYGSPEAGKHILNAYELSGDVMPQAVRRISAYHWNTQAHTMGQTMEQMITSHPWYSHPEESIALYAHREAVSEKHQGIAPVIATKNMVKQSKAAIKEVIAARPYVTRNINEYKRFVNDLTALHLVSRFYRHKTDAAIYGLKFLETVDRADLDRAISELKKSLEIYRQLAAVTKDAYRDCASHHSRYRLIPFPIEAGLVWSDVINKFEKELEWISQKADMMSRNLDALKAGIEPYPPVYITCPDKINLFTVEQDALVHTGPETPLETVPHELVGLTSIRIPKVAASKDPAKVDEIVLQTLDSAEEKPYKAEFTASEPVRAFVAFALRGWIRWWPLPEDWTAPEGWTLYVHNGAEMLEQGCDIYYRDFPAGTSKIEFKHGPIAILGFTKADAPLHPEYKRYFGRQMWMPPRP